MYSGGTGPGRWWGPDLTKTKSCGSPLITQVICPEDSKHRTPIWVAWQIHLHNYWIVWNGCTSEPVNWDFGFVSMGACQRVTFPLWTSLQATLYSWRVSVFVVLSCLLTWCPAGLEFSQCNRIGRLQLRLYLIGGLLSCHSFSLGNYFETDWIVLGVEVVSILTPYSPF